MDNQAIGAKVAKLRAKLNLTTTELAKMVGISQAQISRLENGKQGFRSATLSKIASALEVEPVWFFLKEGEEGPTGRVSEAAATYAAVAHPRLAEAMKSPHFLALVERVAEAYFENPNGFRKVVQAVETHAPLIGAGV
jgi:transcriptional regulator with XRE-family HTH domain